MVTRSPQKQIVKKLVGELAARLKDPLVLDEPFILQDRIPQTRSLHSLVIWDGWRNLDRVARSGIIMDAFADADVLKGDTIRVALGLTQEEAFDMGYLPFKIESTHRETDPVPLGELQAAFDSVGGIHIRAGASHQLRFPSREYADEAYRQLSTKLPGPYWAIVQEVAPN